MDRQRAPRNVKARARVAAEQGNWQEAELLYRQLIVTLEYLFGKSP